MTIRDDRVYLLHILDAIGQIEEYLTDYDYAKFCTSRLVQDAVIRQFEIIGEATKNLSDEVRKQAPTVPWKSMAGMRDKLSHQYFGVDISAVWETAVQDLQSIQPEIVKLLK